MGVQFRVGDTGILAEHDRWIDPSDLDYIYEFSDDLQTWQFADPILDFERIHTTRFDDGRERVLLRFPLYEGQSRRYYRLSAQPPED